MKQFILNILGKIPKKLIVGFLSVVNRLVKKATLVSYRLNINTLQRPEVKQWDAIHGDETLRLNYPLTEQSIVFDVGGFAGEWSAPIFLKYAPTIYIFEPVPESVKALKKKFTHNPKVHIREYGLAGENTDAEISTGSHSASVYNKVHGGTERIKLRKFSDVVKKEGVSNIDLMKINIEGGEYDLLEHILLSGLAQTIDNIQVQFHDFVPNAESRMNTVREKLTETHHLTYEYKFVWENWKKNS